ncbi:MAG: NifB/NifX family molybdenum-iron cluster-binding protein [Candidatus Nitricoxidivorans perseverans]|uniref:NifB/NifX family molybdenum-iron cluster-binding protein n=1 Tax=Candidatus Nitricoxidivorans perseverans TaxID=2975601 RepID=A0AA49FLB3_9PROT|nr:MAG: NifB/NifX family molybdenum-iron cluster-binding protein [Candidatus Nitricoxidivorans perseverans]
MRGSILAACASNEGEMLDGHFGSCERFLIYEVGAEESRLVAVRPAPGDDGTSARVRLVADCQVVFLQSIGGPAAAKVVRAGVHPVKVPKIGPAAETLARLRESLKSPPPWLAKAMGVEAASLAPFRELAGAGPA